MTEIFANANTFCLVLERVGDVALIFMPLKENCKFVVPVVHKFGATEWRGGRYFDTLTEAWAAYQSAVAAELED